MTTPMPILVYANSSMGVGVSRGMDPPYDHGMGGGRAPPYLADDLPPPGALRAEPSELRRERVVRALKCA